MTVEGIEVQELGSGGASPQPDASATVAGDIERLNAFDGLFLRAEHLNAIQDYARELALAVGAASGPGVVEGFDLALMNGTLEVGPGLAIDPTGRPLRSRSSATVPLDKLQPNADTFWYVEAVSASWPYGSEAVQGLLCDEPCAGGTTAQPFLIEGVRIQLARAAEPDLAGWRYAQKRSLLSSRLFAREETEAGAWSRTPGEPAADLAGRSWLPPAAQAVSDPAVRLGILIPDADLKQWQIDVWAARRDRGAPPPARMWQWRLGMRPWDVYVAQILQFQDMLGYSTSATLTATVLQDLETIAESIPNERQTKARSAELVKEVRDLIATGGPTGRELLADGTDILSNRGISQLPPAGFLPYQGILEDVGQAMGLLLGNAVQVQVCICRPVDVAQAVQQAQHRDRIRLDDLQHPARVDILVPINEESGQPAFDWVAFVHREEVNCHTATVPEEADHVSVWLVDVGDDDKAQAAAAAAVQNGVIPMGARNLGQLDYPPGTWAVPADATYTAVYGAVEAARAQSDLLAAAFVTAEGRRPLGAVRAGLLALTFGGDGRVVTSGLATAVVAGGEEAIVLLFSQPPLVPN